MIKVLFTYKEIFIVAAFNNLRYIHISKDHYCLSSKVLVFWDQQRMDYLDKHFKMLIFFKKTAWI